VSDIIQRAQDNYQRDKSHWSEIYDIARDDLKFLSDDPNAQWDSKDYDARVKTGRPALTVDQLSQFVHQVANDIRMNTPTINIIPSGTDASVETATIFKGLIRNIEYISNADDAYDTASLNSIKCSIGFIRVDHDYVDDKSFEQELLIERVVNPLSILIDCDSTQCDGRDMKHATILDSILVSEFKKQFKGKDPSSFGESESKDKKDDEYVTIAEYFEFDENTKTIGINELGEVEDVVDGKTYKTTRTIKDRVVKRYKLSGADVLEETTFPGKYIPVVPVYGEEAWIDGKRSIFSLIRKSKQAQQMYNLWKSLETELLQKQPNAPIMVAEGQIEDFQEDWKNPAKAMALRYKTTDAQGNPAPAPQRLAPPTIPTGVVGAARSSVDDIKATMGLYNASIGQRSNETSGVAIEKRNQEGDVATFHFNDNLIRSITQVGRILVCAAPEIYDTARIVRIIGEEDEPKSVGINGQVAEDQEEVYDLTKGIYDVRVVTGAPFTTRRQEAVAFFSDIVAKQPDLMQVMGDLLFKNMDFAGAPAMAERMKKVIGMANPQLLEDEKGKEVDPEKQQMAMALEQGQQIIQQLQGQMQEMAAGAQTEINAMQTELSNKERELEIKAGAEMTKAAVEERKMKIEVLKVQIERKKAEDENRFKMAALAVKDKELELRSMTEAAKLRLEQEKLEQAEQASSQELDNPIAMQEQAQPYE